MVSCFLCRCLGIAPDEGLVAEPPKFGNLEHETKGQNTVLDERLEYSIEFQLTVRDSVDHFSTPRQSPGADHL